MRFFRKLAGILGFAKDELHEVKDDDNNNDDADVNRVESHIPRKGFSVPVKVPVDRAQLGPVLVPCNAGDGGVQNCLGALDGTYIRIKVAEVDKPRYRTRKADIATNVLGVCSHDMQFNYILSGWEGSAQDSRVLRNAISRPNGLKVPNGCYYLVDAGYPNGKGFLAPFRGQRYHLNDWKDGYLPQTPEEFFNMKHSSARNVIERCFGLLKLRWAILRSPSWYPPRTHNRIVIACCLLHNLIRQEMAIDPLDVDLLEDDVDPNFYDPIGEPITYIETCEEWTTFRANLATQMYNEWIASRID